MLLHFLIFLYVLQEPNDHVFQQILDKLVDFLHLLLHWVRLIKLSIAEENHHKFLFILVQLRRLLIDKSVSGVQNILLKSLHHLTVVDRVNSRLCLLLQLLHFSVLKLIVRQSFHKLFVRGVLHRFDHLFLDHHIKVLLLVVRRQQPLVLIFQFCVLVFQLF